MNLEHALNRFGRDNVARIEFDETGQVTAVDLVDHSQVLLSKTDAPVGVAVTGAPRPIQVPTWEEATEAGRAVLRAVEPEPNTPPNQDFIDRVHNVQDRMGINADPVEAEPAEPAEPDSPPPIIIPRWLADTWWEHQANRTHEQLMQAKTDLNANDPVAQVINDLDHALAAYRAQIWDGLLSGTPPEE